MMIMVHILLITIMLSCGNIFGMEKESSKFEVVEFELAEQLQCASFTENGMPDVAIAKIKDYAKDHVRLTRVLNNKNGAEQVLDFVEKRCPCFWRENAGIGCRDRQNFYKELAAALLGTRGAIECGREYVKDNDKAKRLRTFLFDIVKYGHEDDRSRLDGFIFPNEGVDIIAAGIDILVNTQIRNDLLVNAARFKKIKTVNLLLDCGADIETTLVYESWCYWAEKELSKTKSYTALYAAAGSGQILMIDLLINRKANINALDNFGRTPLIFAAMHGCAEAVEKLVVTGADKSIRDASGQCAFDHAAEGFSKALDQDKEKYEKIIKLLENAK